MSVFDWFSKWVYRETLGEQFEKDFLDSIYKRAKSSETLFGSTIKLDCCPDDLKRSTFDDVIDRGMEAIYNRNVSKHRDVIFCKPEFYEKYKAECRGEGSIPAPKPDTVESVLSQFIALGYEKPVVVIKGETMLDGSELWSATIDGDVVKWTVMFGFFETVETSLCGIETQVIKAIKYKLSTTAKTETEITY